jgi:hypothetical protein
MKILATYDGLKVPSSALPYLVNADPSGLSDADQRIHLHRVGQALRLTPKEYMKHTKGFSRDGWRDLITHNKAAVKGRQPFNHMKTTGKITTKRYACQECGHETTQSTNHFGQTYS